MRPPGPGAPTVHRATSNGTSSSGAPRRPTPPRLIADLSRGPAPQRGVSLLASTPKTAVADFGIHDAQLRYGAAGSLPSGRISVPKKDGSGSGPCPRTPHARPRKKRAARASDRVLET